MWHLFKQDAARWIIPEAVSDPALVTPLVAFKLLLRHMPLRAVAWARLGAWCKQRRLPLLTGIIYRHIFRRFGLELSFDKPIGGGLYIAHPHGCVVAVERIGRNVSIIAAVTIGKRNEDGFPVLGDDVFIGAGARVLGGITLGDGSRIGANAVVIDDVPPGATAVGIPARVRPAPAAVPVPS